jgi:8-oxo-dGTP pyrophosphatase MutT (NUDIX family)
MILNELWSNLTELRDTVPYPVYDIKSDNGVWRASFDTDAGKEYGCRAREYPAGDWTFVFSSLVAGMGGEQFNLSGSGDAGRVMITVIAVLKRFIADMKPMSVGFASGKSEHSRIRLYQTLCSQVAKHIPGYYCKDYGVDDGLHKFVIQPTAPHQLTEFRDTLPYPLTPRKYYGDNNDIYTWSTTFTSDNKNRYSCRARDDGRDDSTWDFEFAQISRYGAGGPREYGITGTGDASKIIQTVITAFKQFIAEVNPKYVEFASLWSERGRTSLYQRLCREISKHIDGYSCSPASGINPTSFFVTRDAGEEEPELGQDDEYDPITEAHYIGRYTDWGWIRPDGKIFHGDKYPDYRYHETMIQGLLGMDMDISQAQKLGWVSFQVETNPIFETGKLTMSVANAIKDICDLNFHADWFKVIINPGRVSLLGTSPDQLMLKMRSHMRVLALAESAESHTDAGELLKRFLKFAVRQLKLPALPSIKFEKSLQSHRTDHQTFGYFDPNTDEIHVAVGGRHIMDTLRTLAHELVHHSQRLRGDMNHHSGDTGSSEENEANTQAGILMRDFADAEPQGFNVVKENDAEHAEALKQTGFWGRQAAGCVFVAEDTGRFCIAHRSAAVQEPGTWGTIGGAIDESEDPAEAVRREVAEETGYTGDMQLIPLMVFRAPKGSFKYHNFLAVVSTEFTPDLNWETQAYAWFKFGEWPSPLHPGLKSLLADPASTTIMRDFARDLDVREDLHHPARPGSRPGSLRRKAGKQAGEKITDSDLQKLQSRANKMQRSSNSDTRARGVQLTRQINWHHNFHKK